MIASIRGQVQAAGAGWVVVEVGGVGMRVEVPSGRIPQFSVGEEASLLTHLVVREDSLTLYGFLTNDELTVFGHLIAVSGVGPRSALGVLSALNPMEVARAVSAEDEKPFRKVSGIGPKTAKLITVSLQGKLSELSLVGELAEPDPLDPHAEISEGVIEGLAGLGISESDARQAVEDAIGAGAPIESSGLLRAALALIQGGRSGKRAGL